MRRWRGWVRIMLALGLLAAGCGGGSGNKDNKQEITVVVAPSVAVVTVNGTLQFAAAVQGAKSATIASNGAARAANIVTITTTAAHGFTTGQIVVIAGVTDVSFNGTFTIATVPSTTTFTYPQTGPDASSGSGIVANNTVTWSVNDVAGGNSTVGTITTSGLYTAPAVVPAAITATIAASGAVRSSNVVTITTTAAHGFIVGQTVVIAGVTDVSFNGTFLIATVPSTTTFTYTQAGTNATSGGGTASGTTVTVKATSTADTTKNATATVSLDSGIRVSVAPLSASVGLSETLQFLATVTGTTNTTVNWSVNDVAGGNSTVGTISATGLYTAPTTLPSPANVTIRAAAVADTLRTAVANLVLLTASDPTLTAISPTSAAQGALFQDVYLTGTNFISTTTAQVNGTPILSVAVLTTLLRARIPAELLNVAGPQTIDVLRQGTGFTTLPQTLTVTSVRPAMVGAVPDSGTQGGAAFSFNANGGYFGPAAAPVVTAEFNGSVRTASISATNPARQLSITIGAAGSGDLDLPGLYSVAIRNSAAAAPIAVTNLAVQPAPAITPPVVVATLLMTGVSPAPSAVAVNTATGVAVVANRGTNTVQRIDLTTPVPTLLGLPIPVGTSPTSVAVDNIGNRAVVVNNVSKNLSIVNLATGTVSATIDLSTVTTTSPFAVGVNPVSGLALVAFRSTNIVVIVDLNTNTVFSAVNASTGDSPQVAVDPHLNWAVVTPGGAGTLGIFNMGLRTVNAIAAPTGGASRTSNSVTITTTTPHNLITGQAVLITGVTDASFNGAFTVTSVPTATSFTYAQAGANATSGNGTASYASPVATVTIGADVRGVAINPFTSRAILVNPASFGVTFMSTLDQTVLSLNLPEVGAVAAAFNPFTDVAVTVNANTDAASLFDARTPVRLTTIGVGTDPRAVAIDPGSNLAVVANETSNDVTIISLGAIRSLHLAQVSIPAARQLAPTATLTSTTDLPLSLVGKGFLPGSIVRLDGVALPAPTSVSDRQLSVTVPASFLAGPRRYALDVLNGSTPSNVLELAVIQPVDVTSAGCAAPAPRAVAIDWQRDLAVVTNPGCNNVSIIDVNTGAVTKTVAVGTNPQGVAVIPRLGRAVVTNRGSNNASVVDVVAGTVAGTVTTGTEPLGVAINQDTGKVVVANSLSNTIAFFFADSPGPAIVSTTDQRPVAVAIDPFRNRAAVAHATDNSVGFFDLRLDAPPLTNRFQGVQVPTGLVFDPLSGLFVVNSSLANQLFVLNADTTQISAIRVGINPTSLAFNPQSSTFMTVNTTSGTMSVLDILSQRVRHVLSLPGSQQFSVDIHPRTNLAVIADENNNRVLLVPLPH